MLVGEDGAGVTMRRARMRGKETKDPPDRPVGPRYQVIFAQNRGAERSGHFGSRLRDPATDTRISIPARIHIFIPDNMSCVLGTCSYHLCRFFICLLGLQLQISINTNGTRPITIRHAAT